MLRVEILACCKIGLVAAVFGVVLEGLIDRLEERLVLGWPNFDQEEVIAVDFAVGKGRVDWQNP